MLFINRVLVLLTVMAFIAGCGDKKSTGGDQPGFWSPYTGTNSQVSRSKTCGADTWTTATSTGVLCEDGPPFTVEAPGFTQDTLIKFEGKNAAGQDSVDVIIRGKVRQGIYCQGDLEFHTWMKPQVSAAWTQYVTLTLTYTNPACEQYNLCYAFELERTRTGDAPDPCVPSEKRSAIPGEIWELIATSQ